MGTALIKRQQAEAALRDREDRLQRVLDALPMAAYTCDTDGLITYFNARAVELWGRSPRLGDSEDRFCGSFRLVPTGWQRSVPRPVLDGDCARRAARDSSSRDRH